MKDLVESALKMHPERIILRDCKGAETCDLLNAWSLRSVNGIMTIRAASPGDCLQRLQLLIRQNVSNLPLNYELEGVQAIVQTIRTPDGKVCVSEIAEIQVSEKNELTASPLYSLELDTLGKESPQWIKHEESSRLVKNPRQPQTIEEVDLKSDSME